MDYWGDFAAKSTSNIDDIKLEMPQKSVKHTTPPWRRESIEKKEEPEVEAEDSSNEEPEEREHEPQQKTQQTEQKSQKDEKHETIQKDINIEPEEEKIKEKDKKTDQSNKDRSEKKDEAKSDTKATTQRKKTIEESIEEVQQTEESKQKAAEKQKKSILEPDEGVDASKLNRIEKLEDEGWFAKNKSNIMIGFTVFLLIDIILFVIWLTTSRLLSPIP